MKKLYLFAQLLVSLDIAVGPAEGLLEKGEEDGDDDDGLEGLAKDDEEDGDGKDVVGHGCGRLSLCSVTWAKEVWF